MTPRERIMATLEHREPDRLAIDCGGTDCSSIHLIAYDRLRKHLGIEPRPIRLACKLQLVADCDEEIQDRFHADVKALYFGPRKWRSWESGWGFDAQAPQLWRPEVLADGKSVIRDGAGVIRYERPAGGYYFDAASFVLADVQSPQEFDKYQAIFDRWDWPAPDDESVQ